MKKKINTRMGTGLIVINVITHLACYVLGNITKGFLNKKGELLASKKSEKNKNIQELRQYAYKDLLKSFDMIHSNYKKNQIDYLESVDKWHDEHKVGNGVGFDKWTSETKLSFKNLILGTKKVYKSIILDLDTNIPHNLLEVLASSEVKELLSNYINSFKKMDNKNLDKILFKDESFELIWELYTSEYKKIDVEIENSSKKLMKQIKKELLN